MRESKEQKRKRKLESRSRRHRPTALRRAPATGGGNGPPVVGGGAIAVAADFMADIRALVSQKLASAGYEVDASATVEKLLWDHLKVQHRRVQRRVRRVFWS